MLKIPDLSFEIEGDFINLEQDAGCGEVDRLTLHRSQVALLASEMGVVRAPHDGEAQRTIATLQRRLLNLSDRVASLADWMAQHSDHEHADLSHEMTQIRALAYLAGEWCADFDERDTVSAPDADRLRTPSGQAPGQLF